MTIVNASRGASKKYVDDEDAKRTAAITAETNRATGVEGALRRDVDANAAAITAEHNRATAAEGGIEDQIWIPEHDDVPAHYGTVTQAVLDDAMGYTDNQITQRVTQVYSIQGSCTYAQLASKTRTVGNVWNVTTANGKNIGDPDYVPPGTNYVCKGTNSVNAYDDWDAMGGSIDLSTYETTAAVNTKLTEYSKTTTINGVLAQHQNLIKKAQVTVKANDATVNGKVYNVTGVTGANTEILIVSPVPASIQGAVDCGLYASASGNGTITFTSDIAPASNVTFDVTIISTAAGVQIS
jgi:hypothetical protein